MTDPIDIPAARALCAAATPGPWKTDSGKNSDGQKRVWIEDVYHDKVCSWPFDACYCPTWRANTELMAQSRTLIPTLCDEVERLRASVKNLRLVVRGKISARLAEAEKGKPNA